MLLPCEVAVKSVLPALRGAVVKILYNDFGMKQVEIAKILGITQSAVSHYLRGIRGIVFMVEETGEAQEELKSFAKALAHRNLTLKEQRKYYCKLCNIIRMKGLMCKIHERFDPTVKVGECTFCTDVQYCPFAN